MRYIGAFLILLLMVSSIVIIPYLPIPQPIMPIIQLFSYLFTIGLFIIYVFT